MATSTSQTNSIFGDPECSIKCRSKNDAARIIAVLTRGTDDENLIYLCTSGICRQPGKVVDVYGRTSLHVAASMGKKLVAEWLIRYKEAIINAKDSESGYTALHRSLFHGHIHVARFLWQQGSSVNTTLQDFDGMTPLDHVNRDRNYFCPPPGDPSNKGMLEAYVWGCNSNYNLGLGHQKQRVLPDPLDQLRRENVSVEAVLMEKFHSCVLTTSGDVFTFGHGRGGRLGNGCEEPHLYPKKVQGLPKCKAIALGVDHTVFLASNGSIWTCGTNEFHQLGHSPPPDCLRAPQQIKIPGFAKNCTSDKPTPEVEQGIAAGRYHSLFWTNNSLYTWGLNAGQLGHARGGDKATQIAPKLVAQLDHIPIERVFCSDGAVVILAKSGEIMALHEFQLRRRLLAKKSKHGIRTIQVIGGHLDPNVAKRAKLVEGGGRDLQIFILDETGRVSVWDQGRSSSGFMHCIFSRDIHAVDICANRTNGMLIVVTRDGGAFEAVHLAKPTQMASLSSSDCLVSKKGKNSLYKMHDWRNCDTIRLKRNIFGIHRAVAVTCDPKGRNFCILQVSPNGHLNEIPVVSGPKMTEHMLSLLEDTSESDPLHDVIITVVDHDGDERKFAAHSYVLSHTSELFAKKIEEAKISSANDDDSGKLQLRFDGIQPELFEQCLKYVYARICDLTKSGVCSFKVKLGPCHSGRQDYTVSVEKAISSSKVLENLSAFQGHKVQQQNKKGGGRVVNGRKVAQSSGKQQQQHVSLTNGVHNENKDTLSPIVALNKTARALGIEGLINELKNFKYVSGDIVDIRPQLSNIKGVRQPCFNMRSFTHLSDVTIKSNDGVEFYCHRCLLSARLDYFRSMFSSAWVETDKNRSLSMPVHSKVLAVLLEYVYRDQMPSVLSKREVEVEFLCQVLAVADQVLAGRLVEMCEFRLSGLITLKNVADLLQFSEDYGAKQLSVTCQQFICHNVAPLLEARALDSVDDLCMEKVTRFYQRTMADKLLNRRITPYTDAPSCADMENRIRSVGGDGLTVKKIFELEENEQARLSQAASDSAISVNSPLSVVSGTPSPSASGKKHRGGQGRRISGDFNGSGKKGVCRSRTKSTDSSVTTSDSGEEDLGCRDLDPQPMNHLVENDFKIMEKEENGVEGGLDDELPFTRDRFSQKKKTKEFMSSLLRLPERGATVTPISATGFPAFLKPPVSLESVKSPLPSKKFTKLSQKERKKLSQMEHYPLTSMTPSPEEPEKPKWAGWGKVNNGIVENAEAGGAAEAEISFVEIMQDESNKSPNKSYSTTPNCGLKPKFCNLGHHTSTKVSWKQLDFTDSPPLKTAPSSLQTSNPWKKNSVSSMPALEDACSGGDLFAGIMNTQKEQEKTLHRARFKSITITQLEEKAMLDLEVFYNADKMYDEHISVCRAEKSVILSAPVWNRK